MALVDAQTLKISSASGETGAVSRIIIELTAPSGKELVALQWEVSYPAPQLGLDNVDIASGSASKAAEKMLACHGQPRDAAVYVYRCVLAGGQKLIPNGSVAVMSFHVRPTARRGSATVRLYDAIGLFANGIRSKIDDSQGGVVIQ